MIAKMAAMCKAKGEEWLTDLIGSQGGTRAPGLSIAKPGTVRENRLEPERKLVACGNGQSLSLFQQFP